MSIAYLDPGNIESDLQSGTKAMYKVIASELVVASGVEHCSCIRIVTVAMGVNERHHTGLGNAKIGSTIGRGDWLASGRDVLQTIQTISTYFRVADDGDRYHRLGHARGDWHSYCIVLAVKQTVSIIWSRCPT